MTPYTLDEFEESLRAGVVDDGRIRATIVELHRLRQVHARSTLAEAASEQLHHMQLDTAQRLLKVCVRTLTNISNNGPAEGPRHATSIAEAYGVLSQVAAGR